MAKLSLYFLIALLTFPISQKAHSTNFYFCDDSLESIPIRQGGRVKPLYVHASETLKWLTGKTKFDGHSAVKTFCMLSLEGFGVNNKLEIKVKIEHPELREFLELKNDAKFAVIKEYLDENKIKELRVRLMQEKEETSFKKALNKFFNKIGFYRDITMGTNWVLPKATSGNSDVEWVSFSQFFNKEDLIKNAQTNANPFKEMLTNASNEYIKIKGDLHLLELKYAKSRLPLISLLLTMVAMAALVLFKNFKVGLVFASLTVLTQLILLILRVVISGRAPITNMYETVLFSGFGALLLAMIVGHFKKEKAFVTAGLGYNLCTLMMLNFAHGMLSASIGPLVPVLRDNFWLSTHVTTIIMSYGALALSWVLANMVLLKKRFSTLSSSDLDYYTELTYTCLKFGVVLLAAGIILGGVWADYSWGRFWGWDPKETWSLIVLCIYMAILHGKYTKWISNARFMPLTAAAFMGVMMAWFGVNYILATGLHSYGFSEGGAIFLGTFFTVQTIAIILTYPSFKSLEKNTPSEAS